eukprot:8292810-Ditylum_brightwellii.AAC.1
MKIQHDIAVTVLNHEDCLYSFLASSSAIAASRKANVDKFVNKWQQSVMGLVVLIAALCHAFAI